MMTGKLSTIIYYISQDGEDGLDNLVCNCHYIRIKHVIYVYKCFYQSSICF